MTLLNKADVNQAEVQRHREVYPGSIVALLSKQPEPPERTRSRAQFTKLNNIYQASVPRHNEDGNRLYIVG